MSTLRHLVAAVTCGFCCSVAIADGAYLSPRPGRSDCPAAVAPLCAKLDQEELRGYQLVRSRQITWSEMVERFYRTRDQILPGDDDMTREIRSYQRYLAKKIDARKMDETEWDYLLDKKIAELNARQAMLNAARQPQVVIPPAPSYPRAPSYTCSGFGNTLHCDPF